MNSSYLAIYSSSSSSLQFYFLVLKIGLPQVIKWLFISPSYNQKCTFPLIGHGFGSSFLFAAPVELFTGTVAHFAATDLLIKCNNNISESLIRAARQLITN